MGRGEPFVMSIMVGTPVKLELPAGENLIHKPSRSILTMIHITSLILIVSCLHVRHITCMRALYRLVLKTSNF